MSARFVKRQLGAHPMRQITLWGRTAYARLSRVGIEFCYADDSVWFNPIGDTWQSLNPSSLRAIADLKENS